MAKRAQTNRIEQQDQALLRSPTNRAELVAFLSEALGITVPDTPVIEGHQSPLDYLAHAFFEPGADDARNHDAVVWAARGSGKTFTAALATALDLVFKPGIDVRLLAGSLEQGSRMHAHLRSLFEREPFSSHLASSTQRPMTERRICLANGSTATLSAASQASVRGSRPQKLRIDEADVLTHELYAAAQLTTRSATLGGKLVTGAIDTLSTWHRPNGPMSTLIDPVSLTPTGERTLFRFSAIDVLERCPDARSCEQCDILDECQRRAKRAAGHLPIDDAITMKHRTGVDDWSVEMLCERPARSTAVLPEFNTGTHVSAHPPSKAHDPIHTVGGMDFGFRSPTVLLLASVYQGEGATVVHVTHEWVQAALTLDAFIEAIIDPTERFGSQSPPHAPEWIGVDPAGNQRNEQTGTSNVQLMKRAGIKVRWRRAGINASLRLIRTRLAPAAGEPTISIHPRCTDLIHAMTHYHYPEHDPTSTTPVKDGHDHSVDALRYMLINLDNPHTTTHSRYA